MKTLFLTLLMMSQLLLGHPCAADQLTKSYQEILSAVVKPQGLESRVDYSKLKAEYTADLSKYLNAAGAWSTQEYKEADKSEQLAFLINAYNAATLKLIAEHYPLKSIKDLSFPTGNAWSKLFIDLFGETISLDHLENEIIRPKFSEPRIHFALVCAAKGCPPLSERAYKGANLDSQLGRAKKTFLKNQNKNYFNRDNNTLYLSPVFKWFKSDFADGNLVAYVQDYFPHLNQKTNLDFTSYDWELNDL